MVVKMEIKEIAGLNFEAALSELEKVVKHLESGTSLDDMIKYHEYSTLLKKHCEKILEDAKLKIRTVGVKEETNS